MRAAGRRGRRLSEQQADAAAIKEGHARRGLEEELHPQGVAVEGDGSRQVADGEGNLPELGQSEGFRWAHGASWRFGIEKWRRGRDSNPRHRFKPVQLLSRQLR